MKDLVEQLDEIRRQEANGEITSDESIVACDIIINTKQQVNHTCGFCNTYGDQYCVCKPGGFKKLKY